MTASHTSKVLQHLRRTVLRHEVTKLTDARLLECFIDHREEAAFAALVKRHGPMVWGVCHRLLNHQDAEDAFQVTFLVLFRKAASIRPRRMVGSWLHGVAHQAALHARRTAARRGAREKQVKEMPEPAVAGDLWDDLRPLLDEELSRLPDKYRAVLVLCDLEGNTRQEAARQLGCPPGTVAWQLARARTMLARRLRQRGVALSGGALAAVLAHKAASAGVPTSVLSSTIHAANRLAAGQGAAAGAISVEVAALTEGVLKAMLWSKIRTGIVTVFAIALLSLEGGVFVWQSQASDPPTQQASREETPRSKDEDLKKKLMDLDEQWWKGGVETLRKLAADDLITVSGVGRYDKPSLLEAAKHRHPVDWSKRDVEVIRISKDVAIVTYVYDCKVVLNDGTLFQNCRDRRVSYTWVNRKASWVVAFTQVTILPGGE
jgi:RNA polymerase sigma factor (sigma-70 family)